jgi:hypothetical protein
MLSPFSFTERYSYATVRIEADLIDGKTSIGTGFFYETMGKDNSINRWLLTNKHVVEGTYCGRFYIHESRTENGDYYPILESSILAEFGSYERSWHPHPDPEIDLCALRFHADTLFVQDRSRGLYANPLCEELIFNDDDLSKLSAAEEVFMIGYPNGLWDDIHNLPLIRRGTTAIHPHIDYQQYPEGLIDMACIPGSSGSPIIIAHHGSYFYEGKVTLGELCIFLGVLYAGPVLDEKGCMKKVIISKLFSSDDNTPKTLIHLGYYIKAKVISQWLGSVDDG